MSRLKNSLIQDSPSRTGFKVLFKLGSLGFIFDSQVRFQYERNPVFGQINLSGVMLGQPATDVIRRADIKLIISGAS